MQSLLEIFSVKYNASTWAREAESAFEALFGGDEGRYPAKSRNKIQIRVPKYKSGAPAPFGALIHASNPTSGGYGGMSFVIFPVEGDGEVYPMIAMVTGTQGLSPDEQILGKAGHSRKMNAICKWLNAKFGDGEVIAWAKRDAVRIDQTVPNSVVKTFPEYTSIFTRYGKEIYGFCKGTHRVLETALKVFLDFHFEARGVLPLKKPFKEYEDLRNQYFEYLLPSVNIDTVFTMLQARQFVILQGPPGTGKTRMAMELFESKFDGYGKVIQFHPNTTYESFIGGLAPETQASEVGLKFKVKPGSLLEAVSLAKEQPERETLLIIDEINRADLAKVLGEAIFCFEPGEGREIDLAYDFGGVIGARLSIPPNLFVLGTMNTADRSISILDIAIRRRFAFLDIWPQISVLAAQENDALFRAFQELISLFVDYASEDTFALMPGHSYFLIQEKIKGHIQLQINLVPLLREYLAQGYVANFADELYYYIERLNSLK